MWEGSERRAPYLTPLVGTGVVVLREEAAPISLGRGPTMDVVLAADPKVSFLHAELSCLSGEWLLVDDGLSRNGSYVNGERIGGRRRLRHRDELRFGHTRMVFHRPGESPGQRPRHDAVLAELCRPLGSGPRALPATNTEIARALGATIADVRQVMLTLCERFDVRAENAAVARMELARIAMTPDGSPR